MTITAFLPPISQVTLAPRRAAFTYSSLADLIRPGEGDRPQFGRRDHRLADDRALADHHVEDARRHPGLFVDLGEQRRRRRHQLRRLEHHAVAGDQRRRRLPHRDRPREVPRRDQPDDAERLAQRVGEGVAGFGRQRLAVHAEAFAGVVLEQRDALHHLALGFLQDLAFLAGQHPGDLVGAAARDLGGPPQHPAALGPGGLLPAAPRRAGRVDRQARRRRRSPAGTRRSRRRCRRD